MKPHELADLAPRLTEVFSRENFTVAGVSEYLGPTATAAWRRGEPAAVRYATDSASLGILIRAFILGDDVPEEAMRELFDAHAADAIAAAQEFDIVPHVIADHDRWIFSDRDASMTIHRPGSDHVLGVGAASLSLLNTVPRSPVESLLDLGTGSGVQLVGQMGVATHATGTDIHARALEFARATLAGNHATDVELLEGGWFDPVARRRFDRIVANPPFVVGMPEVGHIYRDSGLNLDGASELVLSQVHEHLNLGGTAHLLAAWAHVDAERWQQRVASWLPDNGVAAWILQRDVADPALYVGTWLRDESIDPRSDEGQARTDAWLSHFERHHVSGIGFGYVAIQRIDDDEPSEIVAEDLSGDIADELGSEIEEYFLRTQWLRGLSTIDIALSRFALRPTVAIEDVRIPDVDAGVGTTSAVIRISRTDGPRFSHDIDEHVAAMVSGFHPQGLSLAEVVELYCSAHDLDADRVLPVMVGIVVDLIRHGLVLPAELIDQKG